MILALAWVVQAGAFSTGTAPWPTTHGAVQVHWSGDATGMTHAQAQAAVEGAAAAWSAVDPCLFAFEVTEERWAFSSE